MSIDLDTAEGRKQYLLDKLDDLLDGINESYGTVLMQELIKRLELTIRDFNDEMKILCDQLIKKQEERQQLLEMLKSSEVIPAQIVSKKTSQSGDNSLSDSLSTETPDQIQTLASNTADEDIPVWEKKLSNLE